MGITLDTGALLLFQKCLENRSLALRKHLAWWTRDRIVLSTPAVAWAEYWRGRGTNDHFIANVRRRVQIEPVSQRMAESAAEALRESFISQNRNSVKHLIDAIVMAHANEAGDAVYTSDIDDFQMLWECFPLVKSLVSATTGEIVRKR